MSSMASIMWIGVVLAMFFIGISAVIFYDALKHAASVARQWQVKWGIEIGSAPRLLRAVLLSIERVLSMRPCRGDSIEDRAFRVLEAMNRREVVKSVHEQRMH